ncbi:MAG: hypothetical protein K8U03_12795 [Planctomycetia bacterium]|nr:hypothetical protein [Planctomycetia bacterium]
MSSLSTLNSPSVEAVAITGAFRSPWVRAGVSLLLVYHLAAVLLEPLATPPHFVGPPSEIPELLRPKFRAYATALSLDHAYKFFAPDPGESHLIRYDLHFADGTKRVGRAEQGFPDRKRDWPRLLYHRYFMLTEFLPDGRNFETWNMEPEMPGTARLSLPVAPQGAEMIPVPREDGPTTGTFDPPSPAGPPRIRRADVYARGIAAHLARKHGAVRVDLYHVVHRLSHRQEIIEGRKLDAPDTYRERLLISYTSNTPDAHEAGAAMPSEARR